MATKKKVPARKKESLRSMMEGEAANERNAFSAAHPKRKAAAKKK
jgi:hypothetical protein